MNRKVLTIILAVALVALLIVATVWYNNLTKNAGNLPSVNTENSDNELAPDFKVYDDEGNEVKLSDKIGKPVVVNFWATWCGPCKAELPAFQKMYEEYGDEVEFMMVNLTAGRETEEGVRKFLEDNELRIPVYFDKDMSAASLYNLRAIPRTVFVNPDGTLYDSHVGLMSENILQNYINELLPEN